MKASVRELVLQSLEALGTCVSASASPGNAAQAQGDGAATAAHPAAGGVGGRPRGNNNHHHQQHQHHQQGGDAAWREWAQDWPRQSLLVSSFVWHTREAVEAIKGGSSALLALLEQLDSHRRAVLSLLTEEESQARNPHGHSHIGGRGTGTGIKNILPGGGVVFGPSGGGKNYGLNGGNGG